MRVKYWKFRYYLTLLFSLFCLIGLIGCNEKEKGETPSPSPQLTALSAPTDLKVFGDELSWSAVENASGYLVEINEKEGVTTGETQFDLELEKTETLNISVYAVGDGITWENSKAGTLQYNYEVPSEGLIYTKIEGGYEVAGTYEKAVGRVVIPDEYEGEPVIRIADNGFGETALDGVGGSLGNAWTYRSVRLPAGLKEIGAVAFASAVNLTEIELPKSLEKIGSSAFQNCQKLKVADLPSTVKELGEAIFAQTSLTKISIPTEIKEIPASLCVNTLIMELIIPEGVTKIGDNAFKSCRLLTSLKLPDSLTHLGWSVFEGASMLRTINFPSGLTTIDRDALLDTAWWNAQSDGIVCVGNILIGYKGEMPQNTTLDLTGKGICSISNAAFYKQTNLVDIKLPENIKYIGRSVFYGCTGLEKISLTGIESIGMYAFYGCTSLKTVELLEVKTIGNNAFEGCKALEFVSLEKVEEIGEQAFRQCDRLTSVSIGNRLKNINASVFSGCDGLVSVYYKGTASDWGALIEKIDVGNMYLKSATVYFYVENEADVPTDGGKYWRYVDGVPTVWEV